MNPESGFRAGPGDSYRYRGYVQLPVAELVAEWIISRDGVSGMVSDFHIAMETPLSSLINIMALSELILQSLGFPRKPP